MYNPLRALHITLGLLATPAFVIYLVSTAQFIFPSLRPYRARDVQTLTLQCPPQDVLACADELAREHGIEGGVITTRHSRGVTFAEIVHGARVHDVEIAADGQAKVTTSDGGKRDMFVGMHAAAGLWHDHGPTRFWGYLVLMSGASMLLLIVSGVLMWLKRPKERRLGLVFIGVTFLWGLGSLMAIRLAG